MKAAISLFLILCGLYALWFALPKQIRGPVLRTIGLHILRLAALFAVVAVLVWLAYYSNVTAVLF